MNILIIEDSAGLADTICEALQRENYQVDVCHDGQSGYENALGGIYDMILLDIMLPKMNGYEVLAALRRQGIETPVVILSAKTELEDKLAGFMKGADDYVTKPFEIRELLMRIQAIGRRNKTTVARQLSLGNLTFDQGSLEMRNVQTDKTMKIAGKEMQILEYFLINQNQVLEKEQIATRIWGYESNAEYNNVEVYVSFLRKKLNHLKCNVRIRAVRGVGYIMEEAHDETVTKKD